jgi:hypothetical protein
MNTLISFVGGDSYRKNKQLNEIQKRENANIIDIRLDDLEETLNSLEENSRVIVLREDNIVKFERILKEEYPNLDIEVIPEQFFRLKEKVDKTDGYPDVSNNNTGTITKYLIPQTFPLEKGMFENIRAEVAAKQAELILVYDPTIGLWFPALDGFVKYLDHEPIFKIAGESNVPTTDYISLEKKLQRMRANGVAAPNEQAILGKLTGIKQRAVPVYELAKKIWDDVQAKNVDFDQEKIKKMSAENPQILHVVQELVANLEGSAKFEPGTVLTGTERFEKKQSVASQVAQAIGLTNDMQTAAEGLRLGGLGLVLDAGNAIVKNMQDKKKTDKKENHKGNNAHAFLSHPDFEKLMRNLFTGFGPKYFLEKVE